MDDAEAWATEERFWLDGPAVFERGLDPACVMAFPGMGVVRLAAIVEGLKGAPRWASVQMTDQLVGRAGEGVVVLGYAADARREGAAPYRCFCTSTYRAGPDGWKLIQHQQTPAG